MFKIRSQILKGEEEEEEEHRRKKLGKFRRKER